MPGCDGYRTRLAVAIRSRLGHLASRKSVPSKEDGGLLASCFYFLYCQAARDTPLVEAPSHGRVRMFGCDHPKVRVLSFRLSRNSFHSHPLMCSTASRRSHHSLFFFFGFVKIGRRASTTASSNSQRARLWFPPTRKHKKKNKQKTTPR
jgi:hypothetical protein